MNTRAAFKQSREIYPNMSPTRVSGFTFIDDGKSIIITGHEESVAVIVHNDTDLHRLMAMCKIALEHRGKKTQNE